LKYKEVEGHVIDFRADTNFGKAFETLKDVDPALLRPPRPAGAEPFLAFELVFAGEHVVGEGGPYRQFFTDVAQELQDSKYNCPLFIPVPNAGDVGDNRDKFTIKPASTSASHLAMFEFLGVLFGCCIRTGVKLPLDLAPFVWKPLVNQELTLDDLDAIDKRTAKALRFVRECSEADFEKEVNDNFVTTLSDRTRIELKRNGSSIPVTFHNREEYFQLVVSARLNEHRQQIEALRRGIAKIVPIQLLNLLTAAELEAFVCGEPNIDVDLLRRHTQYSGVSSDAPHVQYFWEVLERFDQRDRRRFIKFAWAQERLPADDQDFIRTHTRMLIKSADWSNMDGALPRADTCFFNLELPAYSSGDVLRKQLLYALSTAVTMDRDQNQDLTGISQARN
jgi:hypothetical protein